jgi:hypothetical protein
MLRFCGYDLELFVDRIIDRRHDSPAICSAIDFNGRPWLIVEIENQPEQLAWLCAPVSARAVELVAAGRAAPADAVAHSFTGWVELVVVTKGHAVADQCLLCSQISPRLLSARLSGGAATLPPPPRHLGVARATASPPVPAAASVAARSR